MTRPRKDGLEYFSLDVDIDQDDKIAFIEAKYGLAGFAIVVKLLARIYKNDGYYYQWSEKEKFLFARSINAETELITNVINECFDEGFFNKKLSTEYGILTSRGIQKRFIQACSRRKNIAMFQEYFLADEFIKKYKIVNVALIPLNVTLIPIEQEKIPVKDDKSTQREREIIKEKEKEKVYKAEPVVDNFGGNNPSEDRGNNLSSTVTIDDPDFLSFWSIYPNKTNKEKAQQWTLDAWNELISQGVNPKGLVLAASKYALKITAESTEAKFIKAPYNFLVQGVYREYIPKAVPGCPKCRDHPGFQTVEKPCSWGTKTELVPCDCCESEDVEK